MARLPEKLIEARLSTAISSSKRLFKLLGSISDDERVTILHDRSRILLRQLQGLQRSFETRRSVR